MAICRPRPGRPPAQAAEELGGRVALKAHGPEIVHKTELGAVEVGLAGSRARSSRPRRGWTRSLADRRPRADELPRPAMVEGGVELLVGVVHDPVFGPVVACGAGGTAAELLKDVAVRVCPLAGGDAAAMVGSLAIARC